ncbi:unnamed protein product [Rhizoctonia solani]|uniref:Uncharacterized protein n=1 Tax=Rhizoctonia solani TaxID=456999 RepID=A0A8H2WU41_9AGAM|nr:unnamed protein product [Rhizoctonia solani]
MGLRLTNLKDLREDANSGLKRFWVQAPGASKAGNMKPIDEESDTDSELGLWEVDSQGEPVTTDIPTPSKPTITTTPSVNPGPSSKGSTFKQIKLSMSRGSVPIERSNPPKRKRSASVGANPANKSSRTDLNSIQTRRELLPMESKAAHKVVIDVDSLCPDCLQDIDTDHECSATCPQVLKENSLASRDKHTKRGPKQSAQAKLPSLFNKKRS